MKLTLQRLVLRNFKGCRSFEFDANGFDCSIFGDNATFKTTLFDAFVWLLFDKDSQNKKDFDIKTLDASGNVINGLEHEVEGTLLINGKQVVLRKVYSEKWTKKRGSAESEFSGNTTDYYINGVPSKLKEFKDRVDGIVNENIFKLLTSPSYFNEQLSWQDRRKTLIEICGELSNSEVIASESSLSRLPGLIGDHSIENYRKILAAKRSEINKELDKLPIRIDEAERSKPDIQGSTEEKIQLLIDSARLDINSKEANLSRIQSGGEITAQQNRLREIEGELLDIKNRVQSVALVTIATKRKKLVDIETKIYRLSSENKNFECQIADNSAVIDAKRLAIKQLREEWAVVNVEELPPAVMNETCPTCNQSLPEEEVQQAKDKALANFNRSKSERLERIVSQGKTLTTEGNLLTERNVELHGMNEILLQELMTEREYQESAQRELEQLQSGIKDVTTEPEYISKMAEKEILQNKLTELQSSVSSEVETVKSSLSEARSNLRSLEQKFSGFSQVKVLDERILTLKLQERQLAQEYEQLEGALHLTEEFIRAKVNLLESRINSKFKYARFKLFDQQINGGLAETCETLYKGVPYGSGLNNAARINVGLDIISTLQDHYGISVPAWIDNAEAVTQLIPMTCQIITLYVSEKDKQLRVETPNKLQEVI